MSAPATYNLPDHYVGASFKGDAIQFEDLNDNVITLTNVTIEWVVREWSVTGKLLRKATVGDGLSLQDSDQTLILDAFLPDFGAGVHHHALSFTWPNGFVDPIWKGTWNFCEDAR